MMSIKDETEIRNLVARLAIQADGDDIDQYIALFTEDAEWRMSLPDGETRSVGHADIKAAALQRRAAGVQGAGSHTRHAITTLAIEVRGATATGRCYMLVLKNADATPVVSGMVVYDDHYRKTPEGWRLASRRVTRG